jgi:hypothetical protein
MDEQSRAKQIAELQAEIKRLTKLYGNRHLGHQMRMHYINQIKELTLILMTLVD